MMKSSLIYLLICGGMPLLCTAVAHAQKMERNSDSKWEVDRKIDPILDTKNITAHLWETGARKSLFRQKKSLVVRCREQKLDIYVVWGAVAALGFSTRNHSIDVIVRFDSEKPKKEKWSRSTNHNATFARKPSQFAILLKKHQRLAMRTYPKAGTSLTAVFDLVEAKPIVDEITKACAK